MAKMVHDHTYYLASPSETLGANPVLGPALERIWQGHRVTAAVSYYDGASVWHSNGTVHVRVVRASIQPGQIDVIDVLERPWPLSLPEDQPQNHRPT